MTGKKLRVAIIGMGLQGQRLANAVAASKHAVLVATASEREKGSLEAVLKDDTIDAVIIATPNDKHAKQAIAAAKAGKHILCEKPLALSAQEGRRIFSATKKHKVKCFVNYHLRVHPEVLRAKKLVAQKKLGHIAAIEMLWAIGNYGEKKLPPLPAHMRWRESVAAGGGTTATRGVHLFDLLRFITGSQVVVVGGSSDATKSSVDQTAITLLRADDAPTVITTSKLMPGADNRVIIYGSKETLALRELFVASPHDMYVTAIDHFAHAVRGKKTPLATIEDGIAVDAMADAFKRKALGA